jgi:hypothetical protein
VACEGLGLCFESGVWVLGFSVWGLGYGNQYAPATGSWLRVSGVKFWVPGFMFRV